MLAGEAGQGPPRLEQPPQPRPNDLVFVCRYTGQLFQDYE